MFHLGLWQCWRISLSPHKGKYLILQTANYSCDRLGVQLAAPYMSAYAAGNESNGKEGKVKRQRELFNMWLTGVRNENGRILTFKILWISRNAALHTNCSYSNAPREMETQVGTKLNLEVDDGISHNKPRSKVWGSAERQVFPPLIFQKKRTLSKAKQQSLHWLRNVGASTPFTTCLHATYGLELELCADFFHESSLLV